MHSRVLKEKYRSVVFDEINLVDARDWVKAQTFQGRLDLLVVISLGLTLDLLLSTDGTFASSPSITLDLLELFDPFSGGQVGQILLGV